jgi:cytochrome P450
MMHDNPTLFPSPRSFQPDRWLQPNSAQLRKYLVPFSKGSRQCLGMQLAYCELYLIVAALFAPRRFEWELFETTERDVAIEHDFFNAFHAMDSKGVRVVVKNA